MSEDDPREAEGRRGWISRIEAGLGGLLSADPPWAGVLLLVGVLIYVALAASLVRVASAGPRLAGIYVSDEENIALGLLRMIEGHTIVFGVRQYPGAYMNASAALALLLKVFGLPVPSGVLVGPRIVSVLASGLALALLAGLVRRLNGRALMAGFAASALASSGVYYWLSWISHPDVLQVAFMVASLFFLVGSLKEEGRRAFLLSAAFAGLAFATKYAGAFITPSIALAAWLRHRSAIAEGREGRGVRELAIAALVFLGAAIVAWPQSLALRATLRKIAAQGAETGRGHVYLATEGPLTWISRLASAEVAGVGVTVAFLVVVVLLLYFAWKRWRGRGEGRALGDLAVVALPPCLYLFFLMVMARHFAPRFLLPALPFVFVVAGVGLLRFSRSPVLVSVLLASWLVFALPPRLRASWARHEKRMRVARSPAPPEGAFLMAEVPEEAKIVYDHYAYVPYRFRNAVSVWALEPEILERERPEVIVTKDVIEKRYADPALAERSILGPERYRAVAEIYRLLDGDRLPGYHRVRTFPSNGVRVYFRDEP